jgi:hypothetical protein
MTFWSFSEPFLLEHRIVRSFAGLFPLDSGATITTEVAMTLADQMRVYVVRRYIQRARRSRSPVPAAVRGSWQVTSSEK